MRDHTPHDPFERRPGRGERGPRVFAPGDLKLLMLACWLSNLATAMT